MHPNYAVFIVDLSKCIFKGTSMSLPGWNVQELHLHRNNMYDLPSRYMMTDFLTSVNEEAGKDTIGVPLLNSAKNRSIWDLQQMHVPCLRDVSRVQLNIKSRETFKEALPCPSTGVANNQPLLSPFIFISTTRFHLGKNKP